LYHNPTSHNYRFRYKFLVCSHQLRLSTQQNTTARTAIGSLSHYMTTKYETQATNCDMFHNMLPKGSKSSFKVWVRFLEIAA